MKQEEKDLLFKDLCARLPYHVIVEYRGANVNLTQYARSVKIENCRPYLRPMSSMTEEEKHYIRHHFCPEYYFDVDLQGNISDNEGSYIYEIELSKIVGYIDYLNAHHFDYRGLIEKGLTLPAPEGMYN